MTKTPRARPAKAEQKSAVSQRFEPAKLDALFLVLDAVAWMDTPTSAQVAQFSNIDPRTAGKLLKNASQIGLIETIANGYALLAAYPYRGNQSQKEDVVREALVKLPLLSTMRQFIKLGDNTEVALRKAATVQGIFPFNATDLNPLLLWAKSLDALKPGLLPEDLVDAAEIKKTRRHAQDSSERIAFLSHSSHDKPFVRQLAADLTEHGISVWLDEQRIHVGDSIPEKIAQGLAESDFFLICISNHSVNSEWVRRELNNALVAEVSRRKVKIMPLKLDNATMPTLLSDKKYANFSNSYKSGLEEVIQAIGG